MQCHQTIVPFFQSAKSFDLVKANIKYSEIEWGSLGIGLPVDCDRCRPRRLKTPHSPAGKKNTTVQAAIRIKNTLKIPTLKTDTDFSEGCTHAYPQPGLTIPINTTLTHHRRSESKVSQWSFRIRKRNTLTALH